MKKVLQFLTLAALFVVPWGGYLNQVQAQATLTVHDGLTTNQKIPAYIYYWDEFTRSQFVIPATELAPLNGLPITSLTFYTNSSNVPYTSTSVADVYLMEVDYTSISDFEEKEDATIVYSGTVSIVSVSSGGEMTIVFDTPFDYNGGNLLIGIENTTDAGYKGINFYGETVAGASVSGSNASSLSSVTADQMNFLPKTTFTYTPPAGYCYSPTALAASAITDATATLNWTAGGTETSWTVEYGTASDFVGATSRNVSGTTTLNLTGLDLLTTYYARVKAVCGVGDESNWSNVVSFGTTAVATAVGDSWSDNFEGASCGWELINGTPQNQWTWGTATNNGGTHAIYISNDDGTTNVYSGNSATMVYATKLLTFADGKYEFTYDWLANGESNYDYLRVALVPGSTTLTAGTNTPSGFNTTTLPSGWIALDGGSKLNLVTSWQSKSVAINVAAGNYYLVLAWRNDGSTANNPPAAVDNVSITRFTCTYDVEDLVASSFSSSGATLNWTAGEATQWQVSYSTSSTFETSTEATVNAATYDLTGLTPATTYYARVRAYCGGTDYGSWSDPISFSTECLAIAAQGYSEDFDDIVVSTEYTPSSRTLPLCWNYINECTNNSYKYYPTTYYYSYTNYSHSSPNCLRFYSSNYYDPQPQYAVLPEMTGLAGKQVTLWARGYNTSSTFKIGTMSDPNDASTFELITEQTGLTTSYQEFECIVPATTDAYLAIMIDAASSSRTTNGVYIDDISIAEPPSCEKPSSLTRDNVQSHTVDLTWTKGNDETAWVVTYKKSADLEYNDEVELTSGDVAIEGNTVTYTLTGLDPETGYNAKVRANCGGGDYSDWNSTPVSFTTTVACPAPTAITITDVTTTTAQVSWTSDASDFSIQVGDDVTEHVSSPYQLTGLTVNTAYTVKVKAICGGIDGESAWSSTASFTTKCDAVTDFPWTEDFDDLTEVNSIPDCWNNEDGTTTNATYKWCYNTSTSGNGATSGTGHSGNCVRFNSYNNSGSNTNYLKTVPLSLPASPAMQLTFWYKNPTGGDFSVYISTDGGSTYTTSLATGLTGVSSWTQVDPIILNAYAGQDVVIVFKGTSNYGSGDAYIYLDDVTVEEAPACLPVSALTVTAKTTTTATLGWTENGEATQWQVSVDDGTPTLVSTNPYTVTGLTAATAYTVKVRAYCSAVDQSDWSPAVNFTTKCDAVTDFPWSENFESYSSGDFTASCWTNEHITGTGTSIFQVSTSVNGSNSTHQLQLPDMSNGTQTKLVLPGMTLPNDNYSFSIDVYRNASGSSFTSEGVRVYASEDGEIEGATELGFLYRNYTQTDGDVVTAETAIGWYTYVFPIPFSGSCYIILRGESQYGSSTYMDNFLVTGCTAPTGLAYSELKSQYVDLSWTSEADRWDLSIGDDDHPIELTTSDVTIDGTTVTYRLAGLDAETPYTVKVRNNCGTDGVSLWSTPLSFTTLADCGNPEDVTISHVGAHVADVAWTGNGDEFTVWYRTVGIIDGNIEEFATSSIPTGWENKSGLLSSVMDGSAALGNTPQWLFGTNNGVFDSHARINIYGTSRNGWLISPATELNSGAVLNFDLALTAYSGTGAAANTGDDDRFVVLISTDDEATWTIVREWNNSGSSYVYNDIATAGMNVTIDLNDYAGESVRIAFYGESTVSNADNNLHIDNVTIGVEVAAGSWVAKPINTAPAQTTLEDLEPDTKYYVKVTPACNAALESDIASFTTMALPTLSVAADKWYAISTPMHNNGVNEPVADVANLTTGTYDFLRYDEPASTWESQKSGAGHTGFTSMEPGRGYIYRRATDATLTFDGEPNRGAFNYAITVTPAAGNMAGWNLVGNPYAMSINRNSNTTEDGGAELATGGYTLSTNGTWTLITNNSSIAAGQAFLVKAIAAGTLIFSAPTGLKSATATEADADAHLRFTISNDQYSDVAYAMFANGEGLPKISHLNAEAPMLSIATAEGDYAIAMMEESVERFPLHVSGMGQYTLRVENNAGRGYLHLIDRASGRDIDLLATPEYTFTGTGMVDRFVVRLTPDMDENGNVRFVRIDDNRLIVDGEGMLQVFDVMGRQLGSAQVSGSNVFDRSALGIVSAGVYVLRLEGNSQRIVVK